MSLRITWTPSWQTHGQSHRFLHVFTLKILSPFTVVFFFGEEIYIYINKKFEVFCFFKATDLPSEDWQAILWLERYLISDELSEVALVVVSHDRDFLDKVSTMTLRLFEMKLQVHSGRERGRLGDVLYLLRNMHGHHVSLKHKKDFQTLSEG